MTTAQDVLKRASSLRASLKVVIRSVISYKSNESFKLLSERLDEWPQKFGNISLESIVTAKQQEAYINLLHDFAKLAKEVDPVALDELLLYPNIDERYEDRKHQFFQILRTYELEVFFASTEQNKG